MSPSRMTILEGLGGGGGVGGGGGGGGVTLEHIMLQGMASIRP